ncbi:MAG TPA: allophanate hydrolase [Arachnia sp.]|nr:allophanate hydrolase [Arachnia sp.]
MTPTHLASDLIGRISEAYRQIAASDRPQIWITLRPKAEVEIEALTLAARAAGGADLPLLGLLGAVKDNIDVAGLPTTAGAASYAYVPELDATAVRRLRDAGALVLGKTNLDQFATGLVGTRSPYGAVPNAWDRTRISGGSSAGSAVAVALQQVDFALGTDTAGSGRVPAALNGIIGIKPTKGLIPTTGVVPACASIDCVTVFTRELSLGQRLVQLMSGPDGIDALARQHAGASGSTSGRIGVPGPEHLLGMASGWLEAFDAAVETLRLAGRVVVEVDVAPLLAAARMLYESSLVAERYAAVGAHLEAHRDLIGTDLDPTVSRIILAGADPSAATLFADQRRLAELGAAGREALAGVDALLTPTTTWHPTIEQVAQDPIGANAAMGRFTNFCNLLDFASLAVPAGVVNGLPFGVMITGPAFSDDRLASLVGPLLNPEVELVVVGAHLTGQPLNHQLVLAGGSLVGPVRTSADYRLFALDTVPPKPGLVRGAEGAEIAGELWRMPAAGLGRFLAALPAPMVLGTIELSDGRWTTGFLVEPFALTGAEDITHHGGWRAYRATLS